MRGFTLIEIVVALSLFAIAATGFLQGQSAVVRTTIRSEAMAQALALAELKMTETELELKFKGFEGFKEEDKGEFEPDKLKGFTWKREFQEVDLSCFMPQPSENQEESNQGGIFSLASKIFEEAIRKIKVTVEWEEANKTKRVSLSQLYVRFKDIPNISN